MGSVAETELPAAIDDTTKTTTGSNGDGIDKSTQKSEVLDDEGQKVAADQQMVPVCEPSDDARTSDSTLIKPSEHQVVAKDAASAVVELDSSSHDSTESLPTNAQSREYHVVANFQS